MIILTYFTNHHHEPYDPLDASEGTGSASYPDSDNTTYDEVIY